MLMLSLNHNIKTMKVLNVVKNNKGAAAVLVAVGAVLGTIAGGKIRKLPLANKLPTYS